MTDRPKCGATHRAMPYACAEDAGHEGKHRSPIGQVVVEWTPEELDMPEDRAERSDS